LAPRTITSSIPKFAEIALISRSSVMITPSNFIRSRRIPCSTGSDIVAG
jgi:hypothetical protein